MFGGGKSESKPVPRSVQQAKASVPITASSSCVSFQLWYLMPTDFNRLLLTGRKRNCNVSLDFCEIAWNTDGCRQHYKIYWRGREGNSALKKRFFKKSLKFRPADRIEARTLVWNRYRAGIDVLSSFQRSVKRPYPVGYPIGIQHGLSFFEGHERIDRSSV